MNSPLSRSQLQIEADYINTLRAFEAAHKYWFNTTVHSEAGRLAGIAKDSAMSAYMEARHQWVQAGMPCSRQVRLAA